MKYYNGFSPEIRTAVQAVLNERLRRGDIKKPRACEWCGTTGEWLDMHLEDYSEPETAQPEFPCRSCHLQYHYERAKEGATRTNAKPPTDKSSRVARARIADRKRLQP